MELVKLMKSNIHVPYCTTCNAHSKTIWRRRWHDNREPSCGTRTFPFPRESLEWSDQSSNLQFKTLRLETKIQHVEKNTQGATSRSPGRDAVAATRISSPPVEEATASHVSRLADEGVAAPPRLHPRRRAARDCAAAIVLAQDGVPDRRRSVSRPADNGAGASLSSAGREAAALARTGRGLALVPPRRRGTARPAASLSSVRASARRREAPPRRAGRERRLSLCRSGGRDRVAGTAQLLHGRSNRDSGAPRPCSCGSDEGRPWTAVQTGKEPRRGASTRLSAWMGSNIVLPLQPCSLPCGRGEWFAVVGLCFVQSPRYNIMLCSCQRFGT